ncbi:hypothetical protein Smar_1399 [Staphylothermus marinus F1]|uniref:DUF6785 domain-containing protein n=1 Tax=Staphylothermus marinus (strain ATCC 43588 / DSM 3639 / JCM 9404 / F1) TaxID=399550 RepID=A3DPD0_STAMF|nr:DUF6785 family protein [Staphylothermus marinus]ABN70490.1 hypothetical protein Smar_1399 [Staphylothermus marinus F1]
MSAEEGKKLFWGVSPTNITIKGVVVAIIMAILAPIITNLLYGLVWPSTFLEWVWAWAPLILLLVIGVLNLIVALINKRFALTVADAILIYVAIAASAGYAFSANFLLIHYAYMTYQVPSITDNGALMPDLWVPKGSIIVNGQEIPALAPIFNESARSMLLSDPNWVGIVLSAWAPSLTLWILVFFGLAMAQIGIALMFRKPWIDEEMLPFPYAQMAVEVMRITGFKGASEHRFISKIMFLVGAIVAVVILLPNLLASLKIIQNLPSIYGQLLVSQFGGYDLSPSIGYDVALMITVAPLFIGLAFLMPMDILITAIVWYFLMYIVLPPIEVSLGIVPLTETQDAHTNYFTVGHWYGLMPHMVTRGLAIGFPIAWFALAWRHLKNLRSDKEVLFGAIFAIIGFLLAWGLLAGTGLEPHIALLVVVITLLLYITWMRIRGESTWTTAIYNYGPWWHEMLVLPWLPYRYSGNWHSKEAFAAAASFYPLVTDRTLATIPGPAVMEGFKLAKVGGVSPNKVVRISFIAVISGIVLSFLITLLGLYYYGWFGSVGGKWVGGADTGFEPNWIDSMVHQNYIQHMSNDPTLFMPQFIVGIILGILLVWVRLLFPGVPFNPIGILIGDMPVTGLLMFIPNIIALISKWIIIRITGVEGYEEKIVPFMAGLAIFSYIMIWLSYVLGT